MYKMYLIYINTLSYWMKVLNTLVYQNLLIQRQSNWFDQSTEHEVIPHCGKYMKTLDKFFFLHCYTASISMHFSTCWSFERRTAKISLIQSVLRRTTVRPRPWQNCPCTCRLPRHPQDGVYHWSPSSGDNIHVRIRRPDNVVSSCEPLAGAANTRGCCYWQAQ